MKKFFEPDGFTPEQKELQKQRDAHEKQAGKDAKNVNTFKENITNTGVKAMDVLHEDALLEHEQRKEINSNRDDRCLHCKKRELDAIQNSTVTTRRHSYDVNSDLTLEGIIKGQKVEIEKSGYTYRGKIDGDPISYELAMEIFHKYASVGEERTNKIHEAHYNLPQHQESRAKNEQERINKIKEKEAKLLREKEKYEDLL